MELVHANYQNKRFFVSLIIVRSLRCRTIAARLSNRRIRANIPYCSILILMHRYDNQLAAISTPNAIRNNSREQQVADRLKQRAFINIAKNPNRYIAK